MLTDVAFINALISSILNFFLACILGLFFIYQARKTNAKLLFYFGINVVGTSLSLGLGTFIDLMSILITGNNMDGQLKLYLVWAPGAITGILWIYVFAEILIPKKKWYVLSLILTLNTMYLLDLFIFHWTTEVITLPATPGEELVKADHCLPIPPFFSTRWYVFSGSYIVITGLGVLFKAFESKGLIRKKYFYLSTGMIVFGLNHLQILQLLPISAPIGIRIGNIINFSTNILAYLGLRATPEQRKKKVKKKFKVKDSLFRVIEKPEHISEEEITFYREQKICLVCKGKVAGFNIFLCPNCEALYHEDCARALSSMENVCWVCNEPIDKK